MKNNIPNPQKLYTTKEVERFLNCGHTTLYKYLNSGELKAYKMGGKTVIREEDLFAFINKLSQYKMNKKNYKGDI